MYFPKGRSLSDEASWSFWRQGEVGPCRITHRLDRPMLVWQRSRP